jgi:hypothetical protein
LIDWMNAGVSASWVVSPLTAPYGESPYTASVTALEPSALALDARATMTAAVTATARTATLSRWDFRISSPFLDVPANLRPSISVVGSAWVSGR